MFDSAADMFTPSKELIASASQHIQRTGSQAETPAWSTISEPSMPSPPQLMSAWGCRPHRFRLLDRQYVAARWFPAAGTGRLPVCLNLRSCF